MKNKKTSKFLNLIIAGFMIMLAFLPLTKFNFVDSAFAQSDVIVSESFVKNTFLKDSDLPKELDFNNLIFDKMYNDYRTINANSITYRFDKDSGSFIRYSYWSSDSAILSANYGYNYYSAIKLDGSNSSDYVRGFISNGTKTYVQYELTGYYEMTNEDAISRNFSNVIGSNNFYYDGNLYNVSGSVLKKFNFGDYSSSSWTILNNSLPFTVPTNSVDGGNHYKYFEINGDIYYSRLKTSFVEAMVFKFDYENDTFIPINDFGIVNGFFGGDIVVINDNLYLINASGIYLFDFDTFNFHLLDYGFFGNVSSLLGRNFYFFNDNLYYTSISMFSSLSYIVGSVPYNYDDGYNAGYVDGVDNANSGFYDDGYNAGYVDGMNSSETSPIMGLVSGAFSSVGQLLDIELFPNISIGAVIFVPIVFGIIAFIVGRRKGGG